MLRDQLAPWAQARAAEGYNIHWDDAEIGGFPGAFRFDFTNLSFGTLRPVPLAVNAGRASAWAMPWNLKHWEFTTPSGGRVIEPSGSAGFDMRRVDGTVDVEGRIVAAVDVTALDLNGIAYRSASDPATQPHRHRARPVAATERRDPAHAGAGLW
jgi:hypothetical protein